MLYIDTDIHGFDLDEAIASLPLWRRELTLAIKHEEGRRLSVMAFRLLCRALHEEYGMGTAPSFEYAEGGKPLLAGCPHIHFNFSHCRAGAACVVGGRPVGVDAETVRSYNEDLVRHVLNDTEYASVQASSDPAAAFTRLWTMKEAYAKLTGEGLRSDLKSLLPQEGYVFDSCQLASHDGKRRMVVTVCKGIAAFCRRLPSPLS